jgi:hypothetical protein
MSERSISRRIVGRVRRVVRTLRPTPAARKRRRSTSRTGAVAVVCGAAGSFEAAEDAQFAARSFPCPTCGAVLRFRNEAAAIIDEFGRGRHLSLNTLTEDDTFRSMALYNAGIAGPVRSKLRSMPHYVESTFWDDAVPGEIRDGIQHQDLCGLTFDDEAFDLATSSHVMEHVSDPALAFAELHRVLRPGGRLVFSIPITWPPRPVSVTRARLVGGTVENILPPVFQEAPGGSPSLVFTDFGTDLLDLLNDVGFHARQQRPHLGLELAFRDSVFVAIKR